MFSAVLCEIQPGVTMTSHSNDLIEFTDSRPIRLVVGNNDSGEITQRQAGSLAIVGRVDIHLAYLRRRSIKKVMLCLSSTSMQDL